jgi:protein phosphatase
LRISAAGRTDIGRKRAHNEDCLGIYEALGLFVVADGMGGHAAGEVASQAAVDILHRFINETEGKDAIDWPIIPDPELSTSANRLVAGITLANQDIYRRAQERAEQKGMGTTIVAVLAEGDRVHIAHVGDSRVYLFTGGGIVRLTPDHSYVEDLILSGVITQEQARVHPLRNIITRALGTKPTVAVDMTSRDARPGEIYVLCSDGLSGMLTDAEMAGIIGGAAGDIRTAADELIRQANEKGGEDNITVVLMQITG